MTVVKFEIRPGAYYDSVVLMQLQRALADLPGVEDAGVVMATAANCDLLASSRLLPEEATTAGPDDLLIVVRAQDDGAASAALAQVDDLIKKRRSRASQTFRPRSLPAAAGALPDAEWVLVSVPGRYAAAVTREALELDKHVFLYSDNVSLEDEVELKQLAADRGLLLMGPDCGTAIINGVGLGFANRVRRGRVGLVGASGTGLQAITTRIHQLGAGVSQAIGTGGRDLSPEVGGATAFQGLELLGRDPDTAAIVLVSKPPHPDVATRLLSAARHTGKPVVVYFMGYSTSVGQIGSRVHFARSLDDAARQAVGLIKEPPDLGERGPGSEESRSAGRYLRGLFSGGTLAYEALLGLQTTFAPLYTNVPLHEEQRLPDLMHSEAHTILDLGEDEFTQGRLHPMMDNELRIRRLRQEAADPEVGLILLDVVLGEGAHPDPAAELAPAIEAVTDETGVPIALVLVGTEDDPQDVDAQAERLAAAGAS
ncbi:MAG: acyl-CoA synthetase FdrA, partial [Candidatus Promineifilaceae bacterium]|nr:acyl-CoA synthetase FdrA [Candidatus Promineifilaceae bacterium]